MNEELHFWLRPTAEQDRDFIYQLLFESMRDYVIATWGAWDEARVRAEATERACSPHPKVIMVGEIPVGLFTVEPQTDHLDLDQLYLLPPWQRKGIGTSLLKRLLTQTVNCGQPVRLSVLQVNPARRLYERLGFVVTAETPERVHMEWSSFAGTGASQAQN